MLVVGIQYAKGVSKKSGQPYEAYVLHGLARRFDNSIETQSCWISPLEYKSSGVKVGDQVRAFKDGGILILNNVGDLDEFLKLVI